MADEVVFSPSDVRKRLEVKDSTLRKYLYIMEKEGYSIQKDSKGHRLYNEHDVTLLEKLIELSKHDGMTLEKAAKIVVEQVKREDSTPEHNDTTKPSTTSYGAMIDLLMSEQRKAIQEMEQRLNERLDKRDAMLMESLRESQATKQLLLEVKQEIATTQEKKSFFARLFGK
jgi:DNA-binding transcriptional MerR regulator